MVTSATMAVVAIALCFLMTDVLAGAVFLSPPLGSLPQVHIDPENPQLAHGARNPQQMSSLEYNNAVDDRRPRYERVAPSNIETVWQRPHRGKPVRAVLFVAHGCQHQGTDIVTEEGKDGWELSACHSTNSGHCLGLPEELRLREVARNRGYLVMASSGGSGSESCWFRGDEAKVVSAISHVYSKERLAKSVPLYALGASSGGGFVGSLARHVTSPKAALPVNFPELKCIIPQIMPIPRQANPVPTLFVHMPKDRYTADMVHENIDDIRSKNVPVSEITVHPVPVSEAFFADHPGVQGKISKNAAKDIVDALQLAHLVGKDGYLEEDPRMSSWRSVIEPIFQKHGIVDSLRADHSVFAELMNSLWAQHEFSSAEAPSMLDFCEDPYRWMKQKDGST
eukprot:TRINITY_DN13587_c0_g1_i1.p1 TRINITY_DN13587_c0_g1~~TRINITY_DN13587_c0_g1_i1.p1  ORF type:complete len:421 (-),score=57.70 TRINITY_DN13587_c0_g1_i1:133-1320(-)